MYIRQFYTSKFPVFSINDVPQLLSFIKIQNIG